MNKKRVHFVGIGGIGVSAFARYYLYKKFAVSGSDLNASEITKELEKEGVKIFTGPHSSSNISKEIELVVHSPAVSPEKPELKKAKKLGIKILSYPEALGEITKKYFTIAVSGTHGKSTTCAMLSLALEKAKLDPTVILGTKLKEFGNKNFRPGKSKYLVIEADEWQASFLNYYPQAIVLTNIEKEHLDYYKTLSGVLHTFKKYIKKVPQTGVLIANQDDKNIKKILKGFPSEKVRYFSLSQEESENVKKILQVPGDHNICNGLAVLAVCRFLQVEDSLVYQALSDYKGSWRRFEMKKKSLGSQRKITLISDYGHHPTELRATLKAAREKFPSRRIFCVFQPHQIQRTYYLFKEFVRVLSETSIDQIIVTDIYNVAGREEPDLEEKVSAEILVSKVSKRNVKYVKRGEMASYLKQSLKNNDVLIVMGAGEIYSLEKEI